jgi:hypothetical protein
MRNAPLTPRLKDPDSPLRETLSVIPSAIR